MTEKSNHEEAGTGIIVHTIDAVQNNNTVLVQGDNSCNQLIIILKKFQYYY